MDAYEKELPEEKPLLKGIKLIFLFRNFYSNYFYNFSFDSQGWGSWAGEGIKEKA